MDRSEPIVPRPQSLRDFRERVSNREIVSHDIQYYPQALADTYLVGTGEKFRHAGFSDSNVGEIVPAEIYTGRDPMKRKYA